MFEQKQLNHNWIPNIKNTQTNPGSGEILRDLVIRLKAFNCEKLCDEDGAFALNLENGIFVAKKYIWGNIVSCHKRAVISAMNQNKPLIMYIEKIDRFYEFNPEELLQEGKENLKGNAKMVNFKITKGRNVGCLSVNQYKE